MEERVPLADNVIPDLPRTESINPNEVPEPELRSGTYVVQVPKDQVYRVPPPEHALIVERHRQLPQQNKPGCSWCLCIFISVIIIALALGLIIGGLSSFFLKHNGPTFRIVNVLVTNPPPKHHQQHPEYDIALKAENPNQHTSLLYDEGGDAKLSFKKRDIAVGKYPIFDQAPKNSTVFKMILHGSKITLPREIEKSMNSTKQKMHVSLSITMGIPVRLKIGPLKTGSKKISVACDLTVDTLAKNTRVLSQECHTKS